MKFDETMAALLCLMVICLVCVFMRVEGAKDITLTVSAGIIGFLKGKRDNQNTETKENKNVDPGNSGDGAA